MAIVTLGCQMNKHDSEWIAGLLSDKYDLSDDSENADFLVVNTCAVREKAEQKFFSLIGRLKALKKQNRKMILAVAGCIAQEWAEEIIEKAPDVDLVFGTRSIDKLPLMLEKFGETGLPQVDTSDDSVYDRFPMRRVSKFTAWVSIMRGCDNHCSYCIVPMVRGGEQSRPVDSILEEIKELSEKGYKEVTLLGQNVNSYGMGLSPVVDFPELMARIDAISSIPRLRFVTSHPKDLSDRLVSAMRDIPSLCPSLHLPIQSGSDRILKIMNRGYTADHYFARVEKLKEAVPDITLTSDVIVGFPGETDEDFEATHQAIKRARYDNIFLFKYSPRPGSKALNLKEMVDPVTAQERFDIILEEQKEISFQNHKTWVGKEVSILVDGASKRGENSYAGRTDQNIVVNFSSQKDNSGNFTRVMITEGKRHSLTGVEV